ncbi:MAG: tetratricopeptide repeat protein [Nitrospinaceae bacterium]
MPGKGVAPSPPAANNLAALSPAKTSPFIDGPASNQVEVNFKYARQQFIIKNYAVAEYYLKKVILQSPDHPEAIKLLPWTRFFQKRYDSALISFGNTQSHFPENPASIVGTGWCYLGMQFYELAREAFNRALALAPHSFQAMKGRGFAHLALGQPELAWADFARIYSDEQVAGIRALANQWDSQGLELARHVVTHQAELDSLFAFSIEKPRYESLLYPWTGEWSHPALETAWTVYRQGIYRKALRLFQELPATAAGALDGMNGLAWASLARGNLLDAHRGFEKILRAYPKFEGALDGARAVQEALHKKSAVASYYYEIGKYRISENLFASLGKAYPHWAYPPAMLGNIAYQNDRMEEAAKQFAEAFRRDPADPTAREGMNRLETARVGLLMRAQQALRAKDPQKAAYLYWDYIKKRGPTAILDWDLAQAYKGLAWAQLDKKQYDLAIENFDRLTRFEALYPEVA